MQRIAAVGVHGTVSVAVGSSVHSKMHRRTDSKACSVARARALVLSSGRSRAGGRTAVKVGRRVHGQTAEGSRVHGHVMCAVTMVMRRVSARRRASGTGCPVEGARLP